MVFAGHDDDHKAMLYLGSAAGDRRGSGTHEILHQRMRQARVFTASNGLY
jgi:hypothetical protein